MTDIRVYGLNVQTQILGLWFAKDHSKSLQQQHLPARDLGWVNTE